MNHACRQPRRHSTSGFTLVEMLIAVTLVLLMMLLFAQIFGLASESMTLQRALADNDQQVRTLTTVLRSDLQKRTFRNLVPFYPDESPDNPSTPFSSRQGYVYISLNSASNGTDNLLQFTVKSSITDDNADETAYFGKAAALPGVDFLQNQNQPEHDDGQIVPNSTASSRAAEIAYFMRGSNLYRRSILLRDPLPQSGASGPQPKYQVDTDGDGIPDDNVDAFSHPIGVGSGIYTGNYWNDYDFASVWNVDQQGNRIGGAQFLGIEALDNNPESQYWSLGKSRYRFGFHHPLDSTVADWPSVGTSREYSDQAGTQFIGRFTLEEMSAPNFDFPQFLTNDGAGGLIGGGNPFDTRAMPLLDDVDDRGQNGGDGILDRFANGPRTGEDLLLSNVLEFKIEVWDERLQDFAPVAHNRSHPGPDGALGSADDIPGDFHASRWLGAVFSQTAPYAPIGGPAGVPAVFDTWHPGYDRDNADLSVDPDERVLANFPPAPFDPSVVPRLDYDQPPFRPMDFDPTGVSGLAQARTGGPDLFWDIDTVYTNEDLNGNGRLDPGEDGANGFPVNGELDYDIVFPRTEDWNGNGRLDPGEDGSNGFPNQGEPSVLPDDNGKVPFVPFGNVYCYECVRPGTSKSALADEPVWKTVPGELIYEDPDTTDTSFPVWRVRYNLRPVKSLRVTIRFLHPSSGQTRQLSLVMPLVDRSS